VGIHQDTGRASGRCKSLLSAGAQHGDEPVAPKIAYPQSHSSGNSDHTSDSRYLTLTWRLLDFGTRGANRRAADASLEAALASHDAVLQKSWRMSLVPTSTLKPRKRITMPKKKAKPWRNIPGRLPASAKRAAPAPGPILCRPEPHMPKRNWKAAALLADTGNRCRFWSLPWAFLCNRQPPNA